MAYKLKIVFASAALLCCMNLVASIPLSQMVHNLILDYTEFMIESLAQNKHTVQSVLNDNEIKDNEETRFRDFMTNVDKYQTKPKAIYMMYFQVIKSSEYNELRDFITEYNTPTTGDVTNKVKLFRAALQRTGVHDGDMIKGLTQNFKQNTAPKLEAIISSYIDSLSTSEKISQADIVDFLRDFKNESDDLQKLNKFEIFLSKEINLLSAKGGYV